MDKVPVPVGKFLFVDRAVVPDKIALPGGHHGVAEHRLIRLEALGDLLQVGLLPAAGKTDLFSSRLLSSLRKSE